ncbi:terminase family protein [Bradyrhizobium sp. OAE829]|uniref:DNA-packaging protein n=1 Tax=Bradyrhizobium sp. OAE829 TaxID=2663807 RepID=UPI00178BC972
MLSLPRSMFGHLASALADDWSLKARPEQLAPPGDWWSIWLLMAGRGFGKTRSGVGWTRQQKIAGCGRIALIAPTAADCRDVLVEGPSGILATAPNHDRPVYESSKRRVVWNNGAIATLFSAEEGERLRGPEHDAAYCDELGSWPDQTVWDNLMFGLRIGANPRVCVTTTPRPTKLIRQLVEREGRDVVLTRGRTADNAANLSPVFLSQIVGRYEGTRMGRQELDGELLTDVPGALWQLTWIDRDRVKEAPKNLIRIVVAIDPAVTNNEGSDETGIMVAGVDAIGHGYLLEDISGRYAPHEWARKAVDAYSRWRADRIIAEVNNGGQMVESTIRMVDQSVPFKSVHASRGKVIRAEPIAALYEQGKVHHVGEFAQLEDQCCSFTSDFDRLRGGSPDRLDAAVWAFTELMTLKQIPTAQVGTYSWG